MRDHLVLFINGKEHQIAGEQAFMPLSSFLRYEQSATGTKVVCEEGDCGACSVLLGRLEAGEMRYKAVNSCIQFLYQLDCTHIVTIEGLKVDGELNAVQEAMIECHGAQCGFCTPGFVVTMCSMFERRAPINAQEVKDGLTGNLCRCTGYEPIVKAALAVDPGKMAKLNTLYPSDEMRAKLMKAQQSSAVVATPEHTVLVPNDLQAALRFKAEYPEAVLVSGGTDISVYWNKRGLEPQLLISMNNLDDLRELQVEDKVLRVGARASLAELEEFVTGKIPAFANILWLFGSPQIRNSGTLAGNIANGSPIADSIPFLCVMDAVVEVASLDGVRKIPINQLYTGYKQLALRATEIITCIHIPVPQSDEYVRLYKTSKRKHLDISAFTAAIRYGKSGNKLENVSIAFGGVGPIVMRMPKTEQFLEGKELTLEVSEEAGLIARAEITPISDVRGSADFRWTLAENTFMRLYFDLAADDSRIPACHQ